MRFEDSKLPVFDSKPNRYQERGESFYNSMILPLVEEPQGGPAAQTQAVSNTCMDGG